VSEDKSVERLSVAEAAERLGVTRDAIHKRIRRGSIRHEQGEDRRFYVFVDASTTGADTSTDESTAELARAELLDELRDRLRFVERQLEEERQARTEERRRHDTLMAQLMQHIPEIEAPVREPRESSESSESASVAPEGRERPSGATEEEQAPQGSPRHRSWLWWWAAWILLLLLLVPAMWILINRF
jgi:excisionase family DNA binding protein